MRIYIPDPIHEKPLKRAKENATVVDWNDPGINDWSDADAILVRTAPITRERMMQCKKLKIIAKHGIGVDNIDLDAARELNIIVTNTPHANMESVAEMAVSLILSAIRCIPRAHNMVRSGLTKNAPKELTGLELEGKTAGIIGLGKIGQRVGKILQNGFSMNIVGYDPYVDRSKAEELGIIKYENLNDMLKICDVVSIHVPLVDSTVNLITREQLEIMKSSAVLVNTSRGKIVNEADLAHALSEGHIRAAGFDVFETEPPSRDNPLLKLNNFIATPHIGASTEEALIRMGETALDEILRVRDNLEPMHLVR